MQKERLETRISNRMNPTDIGAFYSADDGYRLVSWPFLPWACCEPRRQTLTVHFSHFCLCQRKLTKNSFLPSSAHSTSVPRVNSQRGIFFDRSVRFHPYYR
jgi:hypothetical protein